MATGSPKYSQKHGQKKEGTASRHSLHLPTSVSPSRFPSCLNRQHTAFLFGGQTVPNPTHNFIFPRISFQRQNITRFDFIRPVIALQLDLYHVRKVCARLILRVCHRAAECQHGREIINQRVEAVARVLHRKAEFVRLRVDFAAYLRKMQTRGHMAASEYHPF